MIKRPQASKKKKKSTADQGRDVKGWSRDKRRTRNTKQSRGSRSGIKMSCVLEEKTVKKYEQQEQSTCFHQHKAIKPVFFRLELKGVRGKSGGKQAGRKETGCNFSSFGLYISNSWPARAKGNPVHLTQPLWAPGVSCVGCGDEALYALRSLPTIRLCKS